MSRERAQQDRRTVTVTVLPDRLPELFGLLAPLGDDLSTKLAELDADTLAAIADFLDHAAAATRRAIQRGDGGT